MTVTDRLLAQNQAHADEAGEADLPVKPAKALAVVACMDSRIDLHRLLGLQEGDAHTIRNAGGIVTDDVIRSLTISQRRSGPGRSW